jgi:hypothetical protein
MAKIRICGSISKCNRVGDAATYEGEKKRIDFNSKQSHKNLTFWSIVFVGKVLLVLRPVKQKIEEFPRINQRG